MTTWQASLLQKLIRVKIFWEISRTCADRIEACSEGLAHQ
jgi:hypothetical protein